MEIKVSKKEGRQHLKISGELTIMNAQAVREAFLNGLKSQEKVTIDVSNVEAVDITGLQIVQSGLIYANNHDIDIHCLFPNNGIWKETADLGGLRNLTEEYRIEGVSQ